MISGRKFAEICRWNTCPRYPDLPKFQYHVASHGDWVFLNGDFLNRFLSRMPFLTTKKFRLIVHNTDTSFGYSQLSKLRKYAIHIYAINTIVRDAILTTIPIGFQDSSLEFLNNRPPASETRDIEIYSNFTIAQNRMHRKVCYDAFKEDPRVVHKRNIPFPEYYSDLCRSKFVLCPDGYGIDTHRVYESILAGAIPVVVRNPLSHMYKNMPVCILNSWTDPLYVPERKTFSIDVFSYLK